MHPSIDASERWQKNEREKYTISPKTLEERLEAAERLVQSQPENLRTQLRAFFTKEQ